jgi:hypothetical protein
MVQVDFFHSYFVNSQNWLYQFMNNCHIGLITKFWIEKRESQVVMGVKFSYTLKTWFKLSDTSWPISNQLKMLGTTTVIEAIDFLSGPKVV